MKRILFLLMIAAVVLTPVLALANDGHSPDSPVGLWIFRITFAPGASPVYGGTVRFRLDGSLAGPGKDGLKNSEVNGEWIRVGRGEFAFTFVVDTYDDSGTFQSTHRVRGMMTISEDGLSASGKTILEILDTSGNVVPPSPLTSTFIGSRIEVVPF